MPEMPVAQDIMPDEVVRLENAGSSAWEMFVSRLSGLWRGPGTPVDGVVGNGLGGARVRRSLKTPIRYSLGSYSSSLMERSLLRLPLSLPPRLRPTRLDELLLPLW